MNDWYETVKLNYGLDYYAGRVGHFSPIPNTWDKMTDILLFWASKGVDGFRCDMAEMVPAAFWHWATDKVKFRYPKMLFIGEVYNPAEYRNYLGIILPNTATTSLQVSTTSMIRLVCMIPCVK